MIQPQKERANVWRWASTTPLWFGNDSPAAINVFGWYVSAVKLDVAFGIAFRDKLPPLRVHHQCPIPCPRPKSKVKSAIQVVIEIADGKLIGRVVVGVES